MFTIVFKANWNNVNCCMPNYKILTKDKTPCVL